MSSPEWIKVIWMDSETRVYRAGSHTVLNGELILYPFVAPDTDLHLPLSNIRLWHAVPEPDAESPPSLPHHWSHYM